MHHSRAFWNSFSHGLGPSLCRPTSLGYQGFCHVRKHRSGCGISARWRPSGDVSAAIPSGEPLGLAGYASVAAPVVSQYLHKRPNQFRKAAAVSEACQKYIFTRTIKHRRPASAFSYFIVRPDTTHSKGRLCQALPWRSI